MTVSLSYIPSSLTLDFNSIFLRGEYQILQGNIFIKHLTWYVVSSQLITTIIICDSGAAWSYQVSKDLGKIGTNTHFYLSRKLYDFPIFLRTPRKAGRAYILGILGPKLSLNSLVDELSCSPTYVIPTPTCTCQTWNSVLLLICTIFIHILSLPTHSHTHRLCAQITYTSLSCVNNRWDLHCSKLHNFKKKPVSATFVKKSLGLFYGPNSRQQKCCVVVFCLCTFP